MHGRIDRLQLTSSPPCWMTINKRILISFIVPVIQHGRQGLCHLSLSGMVANHLYFDYVWSADSYVLKETTIFVLHDRLL